MLVCRAVSSAFPAPSLPCCGATAAASVFKLPVETIGTRFGGIPSGLPHLAIPHFRADLIHGLLGPAFTVAMLGAIESLMSAVVADRMSGDHHNPNVELVAQGVANIVSPMFGGLPATGAIARTATNIRSGAQVARRRHDSRAHAALHAAVRRAPGSATFPWRCSPEF